MQIFLFASVNVYCEYCMYTGPEFVAGSHCQRRVLDARAESFYKANVATKSVSTEYFESLSYSKWRELVVILCHCCRRRRSIITTFIVGTRNGRLSG